MNWSFNSDGKLFILDWSFCLKDNDPPHRNSILCEAEAVRSVLGHSLPTKIRLRTNHRGNAWWLTGSCDGFAGPSSRAINSVCTRSVKVSSAWRKAIERGMVEILEKRV